jgi:RNA 2',3'-cyclic 3'-phosphodiesterase
VTPAATPLRLFFALWPDAAARAALERWSAAIHRAAGGRATRGDSIHMTLAFLGATEPERLDELKVAAGSVRVDPFDLVLDDAGFWKHNRLAWAGAAQTPAALAALVSDLRTALAAAEFAFDPKPFVPHVTLVRKARPGFTMPALESIRWQVTGFVLVRSVMRPAESDYVVESRWG